MGPSILKTTDAGVLTLTLNRPERRNALDAVTIMQLRDEMVAAAEDRGARVVVLTGAGGAFSAGGDLKEATTSPSQVDLIEGAYNPTIRAIRRMPKPVIAAIDGVATGYGFSLALAADIRLASPRAQLALNFARLGIGPDGGASWFLPRLMGLRAFELAMTGELLDAEQALAMGLLNHVFPQPRFAAEVAAMARRLADGPPLALAAIKSLLHQNLNRSLDEALEEEHHAQRRLLATWDAIEGVAAFVGKRTPTFRGE